MSKHGLYKKALAKKLEKIQTEQEVLQAHLMIVEELQALHKKERNSTQSIFRQEQVDIYKIFTLPD